MLPVPAQRVTHRPNDPVSASRRLWANRRRKMERDGIRFTPIGQNSTSSGSYLTAAIKAFGTILKFSPFFRRGYRNAHEIEITQIVVESENLPKAFDGYQIMHLTDLHIDATKDLPGAISNAIQGVEADLCVMTGDYRFEDDGDHDHILPMMRKILDRFSCRDGIIAVLGNHDDHRMVKSFEEELGIQVLLNERIELVSGEDRISISGTDDVNRFYTVDADAILQKKVDGFGIALVHSPEMAHEAACGGHALYLCGHTDGGQIALPGGRPLITHLSRNHDYASGEWCVGEMRGFTGKGTGFSGLPIRFNTKDEIAHITLKRRAAP